MIGLIIADDEQIIRQGLAGMPWNEIGVQVAGQATGGEDVLSLLQTTEAQIILTDIRMPGLDGIALLRIIRDRCPRTKVILLTGYQEFDYAYSAIKYGAYAFILKPTDYDEILRVVRRAKEEVEAEARAAARFGAEQAPRLAHALGGEPLPAPISLQPILDQAKVGNYQKVESLIGDMLASLSGSMDEQALKDICIELVTSVSRLLQENGISQATVWEHLAAFNSIRLCTDTGELIRCTNDLVAKLMDALHFADGMEMNKTVEECLAYIDQHYMSDITLASLARHIHRSPIYLSRLIKKVNGKNFTDILAGVRMNAACRLLRSGDIKSYEVSEKVGIKDPRYFSQIFKKQFGLTPTEFRNNLLRQYAQRDGEAH